MLQVGVQSIWAISRSGAGSGTPDFEVATRGIDCSPIYGVAWSSLLIIALGS